MNREIPQNEVRSVTHTISKSGLFPFFEKLHDDRNVIKIEHERSGANFEVTIHFAIMDLAHKLGAVSASIEQAVAEANDTARIHS
jgi:hypothetical protein